MLQSLNVLPG